MRLHKGCITDPTTKMWWRDYLQLLRDGNPQGLSFVEYIANRVVSLGSAFMYGSGTDQGPFYVSSCGHKHPWGESCGSWTASQ